jgi:hypothetical protein
LDLKELGFEGSYDRVAAFARQWKVDQTDRVNAASKRTHVSTENQHEHQMAKSLGLEIEEIQRTTVRQSGMSAASSSCSASNWTYSRRSQEPTATLG